MAHSTGLAHTEAGMFCLPRHMLFRETLEDELGSLPDALTPYFARDQRENGYRSSGGPQFHEVAIPRADMEYPDRELWCPICGSNQIKDESFNSYGGTTEDYTSCGFCGYTTSWADISAII